MATIRERKPGVWEVRVFLGRDPLTGRERQRSRVVRGTKRDAQALAARMDADRSPHGPPTRDATLRDLLVAWFEHGRMNWSLATARGYESRIGIIVRSPLGSTRLEELSTQRLDQWYAGLIGSGQSAANIKNHHALIRRACQQGLKWGWIDANPATLASPPRVRRPQVRALRPDQVAAVLHAAREVSPLAGLSLRLAAVTGARRGELAGLQWDDLVDDQLTIARSITIVPADPGADRPVPSLAVGPTKTHAVRRITLDPETVALIAARRVECDANAAVLGVPLGPWMISTEAGNDRPASPEWLSRLWRRCRHEAGIDAHWRLHDLRHWAATSLVASGEDIRLVAGRLGHARPATTLDVYAHFIDRGDERAASKLSDLLGSDRAKVAGRVETSRDGPAQRDSSTAGRRARRRAPARRSTHRPN